MDRHDVLETPGTPEADLEIRLLGPLEVRRGGLRLPLPRSKKTRALLAYLAGTGREHSRTRLCALLWESTDDPRGALRWSLSKLRPLLDAGVRRLDADREGVALPPRSARVDARELLDAVSSGVPGVPTARLEELAALGRGEFLEGLELTDLFEFRAWCVSQRERTREARCRVLAELVRRRSDEPQAALPWARDLVAADGLGVEAQRSFLELLLRAGLADEARQQFEIAYRMFRELEAPGARELLSAWTALSAGARGRSATSGAGDGEEEAARPPAPSLVPPTEPGALALVGRKRELGRLAELLERSRSGRSEVVVLCTGEAGVGKSRLAAAHAARARATGATVLEGRAFEAEATRPFGPWADALGREVAEAASGGGHDAPHTRESFLEAVASAVASRASGAAGALLVLDDVQWLDRDSAELLHFVSRRCREQPLAVLLLARGGELPDNEPVARVLRSLRTEARLERMELAPLSREEIGALVSGTPGVDADTVWAASSGNPLFALELARAGAGREGLPASLALVVRERVGRLAAPAAEVLRWASVLGHVFDLSRIEALSALEPGDVVEALEGLERHALLRGDDAAGAARYRFAHDVVREAVYGELSQPRRRLMHRQVARLLAPALPDPSVATEVARHAGLAGESSLGVRACIDAGLAALRTFANAEAETLARRGMELCEGLGEPERIAATLELLHVQFSARTPDGDRAAGRVQALAERALELGLARPARLGFQMLSFLRWESSSMAAAHANILQAERVSRAAEPEERAAALGQAARCFVLLERNLKQAEAFLLEAEALERRGARSTSAVPFAAAMLHAHRGALEEARASFREARWLAREQGDRLAEFRAVQHWAMLEIDGGSPADAHPLVSELSALGERLREGSEGPSGRALLALVRRMQGGAAEIASAIEELRAADAKYELAFVLTRLARHELASGDRPSAQGHAAEGLASALAIGRSSEIALARALLLRCAELAGDGAAAATHRTALEEAGRGDVSALVRRHVEGLPGAPA